VARKEAFTANMLLPWPGFWPGFWQQAWTTGLAIRLRLLAATWMDAPGPAPMDDHLLAVIKARKD
jgi:hypothetical protein